jgi:hypothetical protein
LRKRERERTDSLHFKEGLVLEGSETDKRYGGSCLLRKNTQKDRQRDRRNETVPRSAKLEV